MPDERKSAGEAEVKCKSSAGEPMTKTVQLGDNLQDAISKFGEAVVFSNWVIGAKTQCRNKLYSLTHGEKAVSAKEALALCENWVPGIQATKGPAKDEVEVVAAKIAAMDPEAKKAYIDRIKAALAAATA